MGYEISNARFDEILTDLSKEYEILAPFRIKGGGRYSDTDNIKYSKIKSLSDIEHKEKSAFSPKEITFPVTETLFHIHGEEVTEPSYNPKKRLVFLRACDIHAMDRVDNIFLKNGLIEDPYYKRRRDEVSFVLIGCQKSFENCFCVSMGTNKADKYSFGIDFGDDSVKIEVKDNGFDEYFNSHDEIDFVTSYVTDNDVKVTAPDPSKIDPSFFNDEMWEDYAKRCIGCGRCNFSCPTCSCFTTTDVAYDDNKDAGERRRVWAGCHVDKFTDMAGGHSFRNDYGSRMRYKTMHKVYDYKKKFGSHMCVGCGRCDDRCPEYISFAGCINKVTEKTSREGF